MQIEEAKKILSDEIIALNVGHEKYEEAIDTVLKELEKKDKVIDEMANSLIGIGMYDIKKGLKVCFNEEEVKEYFYKKVSDNK